MSKMVTYPAQFRGLVSYDAMYGNLDVEFETGNGGWVVFAWPEVTLEEVTTIREQLLKVAERLNEIGKDIYDEEQADLFIDEHLAEWGV